MNGPRIVFMGTPEFGCAILNTLIKLEQNVVAVVCQPDKKVGRRQELVCPVSKQTAIEHDIPVIQPVKIREDYQEVLDYEPDLIITCAYGQIIPAAVLDYPKLGCINVHSSLLPKLRGGAPIQHAIIDGYSETGVTIMEMSRKMDAGDMIARRSVEITADDTYGSLHDRLMREACSLLKETLPSILDHSYEAEKQNEEEVTFGYNITREEEKIDLSRDAVTVYNHIRGLIPTPCGYITLQERKIKIHEAVLTERESDKPDGYLSYFSDGLGISVSGRWLLLTRLQPEGKSAMSWKDIKNGVGRDWEGQLAQ